MPTYIRARDVVVNESAGFADVLVTLDQTSTLAISVNVVWRYASAGVADLALGADTLYFAPGETSKTLRIAIVNDGLAEAHESFVVGFSGAVNAVLLQAQATVTIAANDAAVGVPSASVSDGVVDELAGTAQFVVMLDRPASTSVSLTYTTSNLNATAGSDYTATTGTLVFSPGQTTLTINVPILADAVREADESFLLSLSAPIGLAIANGQALGQIAAQREFTDGDIVISTENVTVDEAAGYVDVVVRLSEPSGNPVSVRYNSLAAVASAADFDARIDGVLVFAPGQTVQTIRIGIVNDTVAEPAEGFFVALSAPVGALLGDSRAVVVIAPSDAPLGAPGSLPVVSLSDVVVDERSGMARFVVMLDKPAASLISVAFATQGGTATSGSDFIARSGVIGFLPGETARTINVPIVDDTTLEGFERFGLTLSAPSGATLGQATAVADIAPSDMTSVARPVILIDSITVDESSGFADIVLRLSAPSSNREQAYFSDAYFGAGFADYLMLAEGQPISNYSDTAHPGSGVISGVSFAQGEVLRTIRYLLKDDASAETIESFKLFQLYTDRFDHGQSSPWVHIAANDAATGTPLISVADVTVDEQGGFARFVVTLDRPSASAVSVAYSTAAINAVAGSDFEATAGSLSFSAGQTTRTISVPIINDLTQELDELFELRLSAPQGAALGQAHGTATIGANDAPGLVSPDASLDSVVVNESAGYAELVFRLSQPAPTSFRVAYYTDTFGDGRSATSPDFFPSDNDSVFFAPGETVKVVHIGLRPDSLGEPVESFVVVWSDTNFATLSRAIVSLAADQAVAGTPNLSVRSTVVDEKGGAAHFVIALDRPSSLPVSVSYSTADGSAVAASDYLARSNVVVFAPGETVRTVSVAVVDDTLAEGDELFSLVLSNPLNASLAQASATARIVANDGTAVASPSARAEPAFADEHTGYVDVVVRLSAPSSVYQGVYYSDLSPANVDEDTERDYSDSQVGQLVFAPGETVKLVRYGLVDDNAFVGAEGPESFIFRLYQPVSNESAAAFGTSDALSLASGQATIQANAARVGSASTVITITANGSEPGTPVLSVAAVTVDEQAGVASFTLTLDRPSTSPVSLHFQTADGSASAAQDYLAQAGDLVWLPGQVLQTVVVPITNDSVAEVDETFELRLSAPNGLVLGQSSAAARIVANDGSVVATPVLSAESVIVNENAGYAEVLLRLSAPSSSTVSVRYTDQANDSIGAYSLTGYLHDSSGSVEFAPGETAKTIRWALRPDAVAEPVGSFLVSLFSAVGATLDNRWAVVTVAANQAEAGTPLLRVDGGSFDERTGNAGFVFNLDRPSNDVVSVRYATANDQATAGSDYAATSGVLSFSPGQTVATVWVPIIDDSLAENDELFRLDVSEPVGLIIGRANAEARIGANDSPLLPGAFITARTAVVNEADGTVDIVVTLNAPSSQLVQVNFSDVSNSASTLDYAEDHAGTLTFAPGETLKTLRYVIYDDADAEASEFFVVRLTAVGAAVVTTPFLVVTVGTSDTAAGTPASATVHGVVVDESAGHARFEITLDKAASVPVSFSYATSDSGATAGSDYTARSGIVSFLPGETVQTVWVPIINDTTAEDDESIKLTLSNPRGAGIDVSSAKALIGANDAANLAAPVLTTESKTVNEAAGWVDVVLRLSAPSASTTSVNVADSYSGQINLDYTSGNSGRVVFAPGETIKTLRWGIVDDALAENTESFNVNVSNPSGLASLSLGASTQQVSITDNDSGPIPSFSDTTNGTARGPITFSLNFNVSVNGLNANAFNIFNGSIVGVGGSGSSYQIQVTPTPDTEGELWLTLRSDAVQSVGAAPQLNRSASARQAIDTLAPSLTTTTPLDGATGVVRDTPLRVNFSEPVSFGSGTIDLRRGDSAVLVQSFDVGNPGAGLVLGDGGRWIDILPIARLALGNFYSIRINAGALQDAAGNLLPTIGNGYGFTVKLNTAPTASAASASVAEDALLTGQLPAFSDPDGQVVSYEKASDPAHGSVSVTASGSYTYTPAANYNGADSFSFAVRDEDGASNSYTVSINVAAVNDAPVASAGSAAVTEDTVFNGTLPVASDVDGDTLSYARVANASKGTVVVNANGSYVYTPSANLNGADSFSYSVSDGHGGSSTANVAISITPVNDAPVATAASAVGSEDTPLNGTLPVATDVDGDAITYARASNASQGTVLVNANGSYVYTPNANANGADSFSYSVSDGQGGSNSYSVTLSIAAVNDAPTGTLAVTGTPQFGQRLTATSTLADADGLGSFSYTWLRGDTPIAGATANSYDVLADDIGAALRVRVSYTDGGGTPELQTSAATAVVVGPITGTAAPDNIRGTANAETISGLGGNDTLIGLGGTDTLLGGDGNDRLIGGTGNDTLDGGLGIDTAEVIATRATSSFSANAGGWSLTTPAEGTDSLFGVERLKFADLSIALDVSGNAGSVAKTLGAVFGRQFVADKAVVGTWLAQIDTGISYQALVGQAVASDLFKQLAGAGNGPVSNTQFVTQVWLNVIGSAIDAGNLATYVGILDSGQHTQASLAFLAAELDINVANVNLVGLATTGIEYTPVPGG